MSLRIETHCPTRLLYQHVVLVLPASEQIPARERQELRDGVYRFIDHFLKDDGFEDCGAIHFTRLGIATFNTQGRMECQLTNDVDRLKRCADRVMNGRPGHDPRQGMLAGDRILRRGQDPTLNIAETLVLVAGTSEIESCPSTIRNARSLESRGVLAITVCAPGDCDPSCLRDIATSSRYFFARLENTFPVFARIRSECLNISLRLLEWSLTLPDHLPYVESSASMPPDSVVAASTLSWSRSFIPKQGLTLTYRTRPTWRGFQTVPITTQLSFRDKYNRAGDRTSTSPLGISILAPIRITP